MAGDPAPFTPEMASSKGLQAEHAMMDDVPLDVNQNAVMGRFQAQTLAIFGRVSSMNADRREKMMDAGAGIFKVT